MNAEKVEKGWLNLQAPVAVLDLLDAMVEHDAAAQKEKPNQSQFVRQLIVAEARRRGLLEPAEAR